MRMRWPSATTVIAVIALVMSMTGGALAAVNYARNAGAVDGYSATGAEASNRKAAGRLVAANESGQIPFRFLAEVAPAGALRGENGARLVAAPDNDVSVAEEVLDLGVGSLLVACLDEQPNPGVENPATKVSITNQSGAPLNIARRAGSGQGAVGTFEHGTGDSFEVGGQGVFEAQVQNGQRTVLVHGAVRQGGQGTAEGACGVFATAIFVE